jgi:photosystem II stability/assembly factor-like uncharacterized protein
MKKNTIIVLLITAVTFAFAQTSLAVQQPTLTPQTSGTTQLFIAVSPVNSQIVWAAGTGGTYALTTNGGNTWTSGVVPGAEELQFRAVQGVSDKVAYLMSIGNYTESFRIYRTYDGGATWHVQFTNNDVNAFYDCFAFWKPNNGIAHSDSFNGVFPDLRVYNGQDWLSISSNMPPALPGEASFAASGTCITTEGDDNAWIATGGSTVARILATTDGGDTWNAYDTPLVSSASAGGVSVAFRDATHGVLGGGDLSTNTSEEMAISSDGGQSWTLTNTPPTPGAIFCLAYANGRRLNNDKYAGTSDSTYDHTVVVTAETEPDFDSGSAAWTPDEGTTWYTLPNVSGYWAVAFADPQDGWFVGNNGQILKISF